MILQFSFINLKYELSQYYIYRKRNVIKNRTRIPFKIREDKFLNNLFDFLILYLLGFINFLIQLITIKPILRKIFYLIIFKLTNLPLFFRRLISFIFGIFLSYFLFFVFNQKDSQKSFIFLFTIIIVTLFTLIFALSTTFRCIILIAIPKIITTQLRFILLYQVSLLILTGPLITIQANSQILCELGNLFFEKIKFY